MFKRLIDTARSIRDYIKIFRSIVTQHLAIRKKYSRLLSSLSGDFSKARELADIASKGPKVTSKNTTVLGNVAIPKLGKVPADTVSDLKSIDQLIENLNAMKAVLLTQSKSLAKNAVLNVKTINEQLASLKQTRQDILNVQHQFASKHLPQRHMEIVKSASGYMQMHIDSASYREVRTNSFVLDEGTSISFITNIVTAGIVDQNGKSYPDYTFIFETKIDKETGDTKYYFTTTNEYKTPRTYPQGREFATFNALRNLISMALEMDSFVGTYNVARMTKTREDLSKTVLGLPSHRIGRTEVQLFDAMRIQEDALYLRLAPGISKQDFEDMYKDEVYNLVKQSLGVKRSNLRHSFRAGRSARLFVVFILVNTGAMKALFTKRQIEQMRQIANLTPEQVQVLSKVL